MTAPKDALALVLNSGSSSLKFGVFRLAAPEPEPVFRGVLDGIAAGDGKLKVFDAVGKTVSEDSHRCSSQTEALQHLATVLRALNVPSFVAIGHRIVHGGPHLVEHQRITPRLMEQLKTAEEFAPLHVPVALALIRATEALYPGVAQFACFDTVFHRTLPEAAARFPLPKKLWDAGIRRYGFHGISCESVLHTLGTVPPRTIIAHLGNGASITAVADGRSVDTSMGLTPTGGIVMGTRSGDVDPGVLLHLLRTTGADAASLERLLDKESGLLGISGISSDMRALHAARENADARLAQEIFCRTAKKFIAGFAAVLGGLNSLVFSGGIGEHDPVVRAEICDGLEFLGIRLDPAANQANRAVISAAESAVAVRVVRTDEEGQIARHLLRLSGESER